MKNLIYYLRIFSERNGNFVSAKPSTRIFKRVFSHEVNLGNSTIMFKQLQLDMLGNWPPSLINMVDVEYYLQVILNLPVVSAEDPLLYFTSDAISGWDHLSCSFTSYCTLYITIVIISAYKFALPARPASVRYILWCGCVAYSVVATRTMLREKFIRIAFDTEWCSGTKTRNERNWFL